jgi:Ca2+/Na+ antiporter
VGRDDKNNLNYSKSTRRYLTCKYICIMAQFNMAYCDVVVFVVFFFVYVAMFLDCQRKWLNENPRVTEVFAVVYMF